MGCDIHLVVESKKYDSWWTNISGVSTPRNYMLFGHMAEGIRYDTDDSFPLRGFPEDAGYGTRAEYYLDIHELTEEEITRYERYGKKKIGYHFIEHPDWHSASWLTLEEFERAINASFEVGYDEEYSAILAYMKALNYPTRVVFWFDN